MENRGEAGIEDRGSRTLSLVMMRSSTLDPRGSYIALLQDFVFDAPVLESTFLGIITGDRVAVSVTLGDQGARVDSFADKELSHRIGALLRYPLVGGWITGVIGVAADLEHGSRRRGFDRRGRLLKHRHALMRNLRTAGPEIDDVHVQSVDQIIRGEAGPQ